MIDLKKSAVVLALALAMVACATVVVDESDAEIRTSDSGFTYTTSQKIASITGYTGNDEVIVIPETIDTYPVQAINDRAFQNLSIKEVYIPASVTSIGEYAFLSCTNLQYVTICGSATIGLSAFDGCNAMKLIDIQKEPVSIGADAFNLKSTQTCTYRAPESVSLSEYGGDTEFKYVSQSNVLIRYSVAGQVPDDLTDLGFVVKSTGDKVEIPDAAVRHGYDIQVLNGEDVLDLGTFTVTDDLTITLSYKYTLFSVDFIVDGEVYKHYDLFYNDPITLPESPTKETDAQYIYSFKEWEGYTEGMVVSDNAKFTAVFNETLREYTVQFYSKDELIQTDVMKYGETIVPPADLDGYTEDGIDFIFIGWSGYTSGDTVKGNISYQAMFIEKDHEYTIQFLVDGKVFYESKQTYETPIVPPAENPTKETADGIQYTFAGWEGYEEGMIVTDDVTFTAVFNESPVDDGSGSTWIIVAVVVIIAIFVALFLYKKFH